MASIFQLVISFFLFPALFFLSINEEKSVLDTSADVQAAGIMWKYLEEWDMAVSSGCAFDVYVKFLDITPTLCMCWS